MGGRESKEQQNQHTSLVPSSDLDPNDKHQQIYTNSPLNMPMSNTFQCGQCGMIFPTDEALYKHRTRFCIGPKETNRDRRVYYADDEELNNPNSRSTKRRIIQHQSPVEQKRDEINEWKNQRSILQTVQDMEDRIARDSQKTQRLANDLKKRTQEYNQILTEYEQLQAHERDLLRQMFNLQGQPGSNLNQPSHLIENERNQFEILQQQNARLEQERRVIQNRLEELIAIDHQPSLVSSYEPYKLLRDMREQQDQNEKTLTILQRRFLHPDSSLPHLSHVNSYQQTPNDDLRLLQYRHLYSSERPRDLPSPSLDLARRLYPYQQYPWLKENPEPLTRYPFRPIRPASDDLFAYRRENQRLQNELDQIELKFARLDSRTRQLELTLAKNNLLDRNMNDYLNYSSSQTISNTSLHHPPYVSSQNNFTADSYRPIHQTSLPALDKYNNTSHSTQSMTRMNTNMNRLRDPLAPQPYDPIGGFVIFLDFLINLSANIDRCRLITCIHHADSGLGEPSSLQPLKTELYVDEKTGERMNIVLIATKQPVPGCPPQQGLSIIIEIQLVSKQTPNDILRTLAWTKLPLFDQRNRLISGRWKVPLKDLPIHQNENYTFINSLPSFGRAELHYRLVNAHNATEQMNTPLSPSLRDLYFYPPQYRDRSYL